MVPTLQLPHFEQRFIASMRAFLGSIDAQLEVDQDYVPEPQRCNDFYIMDLALSSGVFTAQQLKHLNYCRLYLVTASRQGTNLMKPYWLAFST
jgi:hypothetical protein